MIELRKERAMLKLFWDWAVEMPAKFAAVLLTIAIAATPIAGAISCWLGVYKLLKEPDAYHWPVKWQRRPAIYAWLVAIYVLLVLAVSLEHLPRAITMFLREAS